MGIDSELIKVSEDIISISSTAREIGWRSISEQMFHRVLYLVKVLYAFKHPGENIFNYCHFTVTIYGPYSNLVTRGIAFLCSTARLHKDNEGFCLNKIEEIDIDPQKIAWIKTVLHILGQYGENRVFAFITNDPSYDDAVKTNRVTEMDFSTESQTIKILNEFKSAFEKAKGNTDSLTDIDYIALYFDYVFSEIIKN